MRRIRHSGQLSACIVPVTKLKQTEKARLFQLARHYSNELVWGSFASKLHGHSDVVLLRDSRSGVIRGFCALSQSELEVEGKKSCGVFSGNLVIERGLSAEPVVGRAILSRLWDLKLRNPLTDLHWYGEKTKPSSRTRLTLMKMLRYRLKPSAEDSVISRAG